MPSVFSDWPALRSWLDSRGMFHIELGLQRMRNALDKLDLLKPPFAVCQVLGTNGKGSVCAFLSSIFQKSGLSCGLYTSPHFLSPKERIRVNDRNSSSEDWLNVANELTAKYAEWRNLTYFEFITLLAMLIFKNKKIDAAILEAGLGGRNDATTAIAAGWQCFAPIALDHLAVIGPALKDIAEDKAAAIHKESRVFSARQFPEAANILKNACASKNASLEFCQPWQLPANSHPLLAAPFQKQNMGLATACARDILKSLGHRQLSREQTDYALEKAFIPGRWQKISGCLMHPPLLLDGGHNPHAIKALAENLDTAPGSIVFSCMADKNWRTSLEILMRVFPDAFFLIPALNNPRAENETLIRDFINSRHPGRAIAFSGEKALKNALAHVLGHHGSDFCLVCGSFFLVAEFYALFPQHLQWE